MAMFGLDPAAQDAAFAPAVTGTLQYLKVRLPKKFWKWIPLVAIALGVVSAINARGGIVTAGAVCAGVVTGIAACKIYDVGREYGKAKEETTK